MDGSFGSGFAKAFSDTYGAFTRGAYYSALAGKIARENEGEDAQKQLTIDAAREHNVPVPGVAPQGAVGRVTGQAPAPVAAPQPQADTGFGSGMAPIPQVAMSTPGAVQAPSPLAVVAHPPVAPQPAAPAAPPAQAAPAQAPAPAPGAAPGAVAASMAQPAATAQPTTPQPGAAGGQEGGQAPFDQPTMQRIFKLVEEAKDPVTTMVAAGAMEFARNPTTPEQRAELRAQVPGLVAALHDARAGGEGRPIGKADYNAFFEKLSMGALKNFSGQQQTAVLANIDRIRTQGLTDRLSVAMAAAGTGDFNGAAAALSAADGFLPDGNRRSFKAVPGGVEMTSQPEDGKGTPIKQVLTPADMEKYGATLLNPLKSMEHFLNVRRQNETERHNKADEGLRGAALAQSASQHADNKALAWERLGIDKERLGLDKEVKNLSMDLQRADQVGTSAWLTMRNAESDLAAARDTGTPEVIAQAEAKAKEARKAFDAASTKMSRQGIETVEKLDLRADSINQKAELARLNASGKAPLDAQTLKILADARDTFRTTNADSKGKVTDPAANFALGQSLAYAQANRDVPPDTILEALQRFYTSAPPEKRANPPAVIVDATTGIRLVRPGVDRSALGRAQPAAAGPAPAPTPGSGAAAQGALPRAAADRPGVMQSLIGALPNPSTPVEAARGALSRVWQGGGLRRRAEEQARGRAAGAADQGDR